jgi:hypothetical protein
MPLTIRSCALMKTPELGQNGGDVLTLFARSNALIVQPWIKY